MQIKTDVETQGDFIRFLIKEVENAAFSDIEDVVPFVKWLDDELSYLVDERAVLKHFEWPEQKADALREAAFCYFDLKKLISEASRFREDPRQPSGSALKKMQALFEKLDKNSIFFFYVFKCRRFNQISLWVLKVRAWCLYSVEDEGISCHKVQDFPDSG